MCTQQEAEPLHQTFDAHRWVDPDLVALALEIYEIEDVTMTEALRRAHAQQPALLAYSSEWDRLAVHL